MFLIEGKRSVVEALSGSASIRRIILNVGINSGKFPDVYSLASQKEIPIDEIPAVKFNKLSSTETSQGIIALAGIPSFTFEDLVSQLRSKRVATVLLLDRISDPGNLGTILRSAAWFGVDGVLAGEGSVDVYNAKVVRSAMAAVSSLNVVREAKPSGAISTLKSFGFSIIASSQNGKKSYTDFVFPQKACLIFGSESSGIDKKLLDMCDESVIIPRIGKMESLNVGVASSIILSEIFRQRSAVAT